MLDEAVWGYCRGRSFAPYQSWAGEQPEQERLVYTLSRATGFNDTESQIIASAPWSAEPRSTNLVRRRRVAANP
jgi:hypothetical protein